MRGGPREQAFHVWDSSAFRPLTNFGQTIGFASRGLRILSRKGRGKPVALALPKRSQEHGTYLSPCGRGYEGRASKANPWPKLVGLSRQFLKADLLVHASRSAPWFDHARLPIPPLWQGRSAGARNRATLILAASRQPLRPVSVPRFGVSIRELATLLPSSGLAGRKTGMCALQRASGAITGVSTAVPRGWPLSRTPDGGICVVPLHQAPVPPRHDASWGSRCGTR